MKSHPGSRLQADVLLSRSPHEGEEDARMRKPILFATLALAFLMPSPRSAAQDAPKSIVTAAQVNGTWRSRKNEFKILALGKNQLKVEFEGTYEYTTGRGLMANTGELSGTAAIEGTVATLKPPETEGGGT